MTPADQPPTSPAPEAPTGAYLPLTESGALHDSTEPATTAPAVGRFGDFDLLAEVARDGPFVLYQARQVRLNRTVLLKRPQLHLDGAAAAEAGELLRREAAGAVKLDHPAVLRVLEAGEIEGIPYLAFVAVSGETLAERLQRGPVDDRTAADWARQLAETLFAVHRQGQIHANLRPEYLFLGRDGQVRLGGFGTATRPAEPTGYLPPERTPGSMPGLDGRCDVYGLVALLYAMLSGQPPHQGETPDKLLQNIREAQPKPPRRQGRRVNADLTAICLRCLQKKPADRYSGADPTTLLMADLRCFLSGQRLKTRRPSWSRLLYGWGLRFLRPAIVSALLLLGLLGGSLWDSWQTEAAWTALLGPSAEEGPWVALEPTSCTSAGGATLSVQSDGSILASGTLPKFDSYTIANPVPAGLTAVGGIRLEAMTDTSLPGHGPGRSLENGGGNFVLTDLRVTLGADARPVPLHLAFADFCEDGFPVTAAIDTQPEETGWAIHPASGRSHRAMLYSMQPVPASAGEPLTITLRFGSHDLHQLGRFRLAVTAATIGTSPGPTPAHQPAVRAAMRRLSQLAEYRPHDEALVTALALASYRAGGDDKEVFRLLQVTEETRVGYTDDYEAWRSAQPLVWDRLPSLWHHAGHDKTWRSARQMIFALAAVRSGRITAARAAFAQARVLDQATERLATEVQAAFQDTEILTLEGYTLPVRCVAYSPDGKRIVSGSGDLWITKPGELKVWDADKGQEVLTLKGHPAPVTCVAYSPDGKRIVSGSGDRTLKVWDADMGTEILSLRGHTDAVFCVAYSPDGKRIVSGSLDRTLKVWDADMGAEILSLRGHTDRVLCVAYSPDGKRIVSGSDDNTLKVWDADMGAEILSLKGHTEAVRCVAYSPDGKRIVSGSGDRTLKVWDADMGAEILSLKGHTEAVTCVAYSPDGKRIVSGSEDGTLKVWDADKGAETHSLKGHTSAVRCVAYSRDGKRIVSGSAGGSPGEAGEVKVWKPFEENIGDASAQ